MESSTLKNCWEIMACGRHFAGDKVKEMGECIASREKMGHSCWAVPGTLCGGFVYKTLTEQQRECMSCKVYKKYHRAIGPDGAKVRELFPEEENRYRLLLMGRMNSRT